MRRIKVGRNGTAECVEKSRDGHRPDSCCHLGDLNDTEVHVLMETAYEIPLIAPGPLARLEGVGDWELNRRRGFDYPLQPPEAAIDPSEDAVSVDVAISIRAAFAQDTRPVARAALAFLDAVHELLMGGGARH